MINEMKLKERINTHITYCTKIITITKINGKTKYVDICGEIIEGYKMIESHGLFYRLDLCKKHFEEFDKKEKEEKTKENKRYEKTDFKCPECGKPVLKHYHIKHGLYPEYRWFWCPNWHELYCNNCKHATDSHGDLCGAFFCLKGSGWEPIEKEE